MTISQFQRLFFIAMLISAMPISSVYSNEKLSLTTLCIGGATVCASAVGIYKAMQFHKLYRKKQLAKGVLRKDLSAVKTALWWGAGPDTSINPNPTLLGKTNGYGCFFPYARVCDHSIPKLFDAKGIHTIECCGEWNCYFYNFDPEGIPLFALARKTSILKELLKAGIKNIDQKYNYGPKMHISHTLLNRSTSDCLQYVLSSSKCEPLFKAIYNQVKLLIENGASIDPRTISTLLLVAAYNNDSDFAYKLYRSGCTTLPTKEQQQKLSAVQRKIIENLQDKNTIAFKKILQNNPKLIPNGFSNDIERLVITMLTDKDLDAIQQQEDIAVAALSETEAKESKFKFFSLSEAIEHNYTWDEATDEEMEELII